MNNSDCESHSALVFLLSLFKLVFCWVVCAAGVATAFSDVDPWLIRCVAKHSFLYDTHSQYPWSAAALLLLKSLFLNSTSCM